LTGVLWADLGGWPLGPVQGCCMLPLLQLLLPLHPELAEAADGDDGVLLCCAEQQERRLNRTSRPFFLLCCLPSCSGVVVELPDGYTAPARIKYA
jgi:hypothetical protein